MVDRPPPPLFYSTKVSLKKNWGPKKNSGLWPENKWGPKIAQKGRFLAFQMHKFQIQHPKKKSQKFFIPPMRLKKHFALNCQWKQCCFFLLLFFNVTIPKIPNFLIRYFLVQIRSEKYIFPWAWGASSMPSAIPPPLLKMNYDKKSEGKRPSIKMGYSLSCLQWTSVR